MATTDHEARKPIAVIYLEWEDAASNADWFTPTEADQWANGHSYVRQVGFLLRETDRLLFFAAQWIPPSGINGESFGDVQRIPKTWIRHRTHLLTVTDAGPVRRKKR